MAYVTLSGEYELTVEAMTSYDRAAFAAAFRATPWSDKDPVLDQDTLSIDIEN